MCFIKLSHYLFIALLLSSCAETEHECNVLYMDFSEISAMPEDLYVRSATQPEGPGDNLFLPQNVSLSSYGLVLTAQGSGTGNRRVRVGAEAGTMVPPVTAPPAFYRTVLKPSMESGVVTAFFTYLYDDKRFFNNQEIDFEFLTSTDDVPSLYMTTWLRYDPQWITTIRETTRLNLSREFFTTYHKVEIRWYKDRVEFYLDGVTVAVHRNVVPLRGGKLLMNIWLADAWSGVEFEGKTSAIYKEICVGKIKE